MEERHEPHIFKCPSCPQLFKSAYDEIGLEMDCPQCGDCFRIPEITDALKLETSHGSRQIDLQEEERIEADEKAEIPVYETFSDEERKMLNDLPAVSLENLKILTKQNCWEYSIVAALLFNQLENLQQTVIDTTYKQELQKGWKKNRSNFNYFLDQHCKDLFTTFNALYELMSDSLGYALENEDLNAIFALLEKFDVLITRLAKAHVRIYREPMPPEEPYPTLQQLITDWIPYCSRHLLDFVNKLHEKCVNLRSSNKLRPQISLVPPSFYQFLKITNQLGIGF